ncbi:MAG: glycosyltransferase [candidate division Zixibacteria bacterium]|nr:glycosyltransferase [candidate division Zixibacteria bacterium]
MELDRYPLHRNGPGRNICYVGYLNHKKGLSLLLQCVREAVKIDRLFKLHVAGDFQEERFKVYMHHLIGEMGLTDNVQFHGWVKDVPAFLREMNYVISTSPWEGCPNNLIEAMACGIKPLIHNWKGSRQLFPESLVFNSLDDFEELLRSTDYDSDSYRRHVEVNFNAARNMPRIDAFLASLLAARQSDRRSSQSRKTTLPVSHEVSDQIAAPPTPTSEGGQSETINFLQPLGKGIGFVDNRKQFTVDFCRGKRVLHIGCVDSGIMKQRIRENNYLHYHIGRVAKKLVGADVDEKGLARLKQASYEVHKLDLETDANLLRELSRDADVIIIPEVIEHLSNAGLALQNLKDCDFHGDILITTPNAFSCRAHKMLSQNVELVHPDHNCYYSVTTLATLLRKHGFRIERLLMYYWPSNDATGREFADILRACPYYGEGIIAVVKADGRPSG